MTDVRSQYQIRRNIITGRKRQNSNVLAQHRVNDSIDNAKVATASATQSTISRHSIPAGDSKGRPQGIAPW